jgi:hypothetical protein
MSILRQSLISIVSKATTSRPIPLDAIWAYRRGIWHSVRSDEPKARALACADRTAQFIASFEVPHSLKDVGVSRNEIQQIVPAVLHEVKERGGG